MVDLQKNVGSYDRGVRGLVGIVALVVGVAGAVGVGGIGNALGTSISVVVTLAGAITLFTAVTGFCGAYTLLGIDTCDIGE